MSTFICMMKFLMEQCLECTISALFLKRILLQLGIKYQFAFF